MIVKVPTAGDLEKPERKGLATGKEPTWRPISRSALDLAHLWQKRNVWEQTKLIRYSSTQKIHLPELRCPRDRKFQTFV